MLDPESVKLDSSDPNSNICSGPRELGIKLRRWCEESAAAGFGIVPLQRLQAMLMDALEPCHGDPVLYDYLLRRQGFRALLGGLPMPLTSAEIRLHCEALLKESGMVFNPSSIQLMQAFLDGVTGLSALEGLSSIEGTDRQRSASDWPGGVNSLANDRPGVNKEQLSGWSSPSSSQQPHQPLGNWASNPMFEAAYRYAIARGWLSAEQSHEVKGARHGIFHIHLLDSGGRSLARVHRELL